MASYEVALVNSDGDTVSSSLISVDASIVGVNDGSTGSGSAEVVVVAGASTDVVVPVTWNGSTPGSGVNVSIDGRIGDDIDYFTVTRAPEVEPGEPLAIVVRATNGGEVVDVRTVIATMEDAEPALLHFQASTGTYQGTLVAPWIPGDYPLTISVAAPSGTTTSATKLLTVVASMTPVVEECSFDGRIYRNRRNAAVSLDIKVTICEDAGSADLQIFDDEGAKVERRRRAPNGTKRSPIGRRSSPTRARTTTRKSVSTWRGSRRRLPGERAPKTSCRSPASCRTRRMPRARPRARR
jgi:hypothetical protein